MGPSRELLAGLALLALAGRIVGQATIVPGAVSTLIGGGKAGNADGDYTSASFAGPGSLAVVYWSDSTPMLLLTDQNNALLRLINIPGRNVTTVAGTGQSGFKDDWGVKDGVYMNLGPGLAMFYALFGVAVDDPSKAKTVFVADRYNNRIRSVEYSENLSSKWTVNTIAGTGEQDYGDDQLGKSAKFNYPVALEYDSVAGLLYVSDALNHVIRTIDIKSGPGVWTTNTIAGNQGTPGFADGDALNGAAFNFPYGLALDTKAKILYIADFENNAIRALDLGASKVSTLAGQQGKSGWSDGKLGVNILNHPVGMEIDPRSAGTADPVIYFSEAYGHRIRFVYGVGSANQGTVSTLAGNGTQGADDNTQRDRATFSFPLGLAVEASGAQAYLYVADRQNNAVRTVNLPALAALPTPYPPASPAARALPSPLLLLLAALAAVLLSRS